MAVRTKAVTLTTVPVLLSSVQDDREPDSELLVKNPGPTTIRIGDSAVGTSNGFPLDASESVSVTLKRGEDELWARADSGAQVVNVLLVGVK